MNSLSGLPLSNSQQVEQLLLQQIGTVKQIDIAEALDCDPSKISNFFGKNPSSKLNFYEFCTLLPLLNLALVEAEGGATVHIPRDKYNALLTLAREALGVQNRGC